MDLQRLFCSIRKYLTPVSWMVLCVLYSVLLQPETGRAAPEEADKERINAVLLLDASGSMRLTDPEQLRADGTRLFVQFLRKGDRLAIIQFAEEARLLRPLIEYNEAQEIDIARVINEIEDTGEYTDFLAALELAKKQVTEKAAASKEKSEPVIILLSDGKLDQTPQTGSVEEQKKELFEKVIPELKELGIKIYTLSFSEYADTALLEDIARASGGVHWSTPTAEKIHESFADLFVVVKKPQMVPLTSKGFRIDQEIQEATFYINSQEEDEVVLVSPDNERYTLNTNRKGLKWFPGQKFDVITIEDPEPGQWQIAGIPKNEGFATVLTNLKLSTSWPSIIRAGETTLLEARLYESNKPVVLPEMTDVVKYAFQITPTDKVSEPVLRAMLHDDGTEGDQIARDGIFSTRVTLEESGEYKLRVLASGPTFERHQQISFRVKPRLVSLRIVPAEQARSTRDVLSPSAAVADEYFQLELSPELSGTSRLQVDLFATDSRGRRYKLPLNRYDSVYEANPLRLPHEGEFSLYATVTAEGRRNKKFRGRSQEFSYEKQQVVDKDGNVVSVVVVDEGQEKESPAGFPWVYLVVLLILNGGVGYGAIKNLKESQSQMSEESEDTFANAGPIEEALANLEERSTATEIDFDSPLFTDTTLELSPQLDIEAVEPTDEGVPPPVDMPEEIAADPSEDDELLAEVEGVETETAPEESEAFEEDDEEQKES